MEMDRYLVVDVIFEGQDKQYTGIQRVCGGVPYVASGKTRVSVRGEHQREIPLRSRHEATLVITPLALSKRAQNF